MGRGNRIERIVKKWGFHPPLHNKDVHGLVTLEKDEGERGEDRWGGREEEEEEGLERQNARTARPWSQPLPQALPLLETTV